MKSENNLFRFLFVLFLLLPTGLFGAAEPTPIGLWKTIDDNSGQPRGLVRIREVNGQFEGKIEKGFPKPGEDQPPKCEKCDGPRRSSA